MPLPPKFRKGTTDAACWSGIVDHNEYELPDTLAPDELIVDIGAHIGSFVQAAWNRGSRWIIAFEASAENFQIAYENVGSLPGVTLVSSAVGRSDDKAVPSVIFGGFPKFFDGMTVNTGGGNVLGRGLPGGPDAQVVGCLQFDRIYPTSDIALLKLDCEGSEWPILYTAKSLDRVQAIVGEYHSLPEDVERELGFEGECNATKLECFLSDRGFKQIEVQPFNETHYQVHGQKIGLFKAAR